MFRLRLLITIFVLSSFLFISACGSSAGTSGNGEPNNNTGTNQTLPEGSSENNDDVYQIGALLALTGTCGGLGQPTREGIEYQLAKINAESKLSKPLSVQFADDRSETSETVALTNRFAADGKTLGIVGYSCSNLALAAKPVANEKEITQVAFAIAPQITDPIMPYTFTMSPTVIEEVDTAVQFIANQGIDKIALMYEDTSYPKQAADEWKKRAPEFGIEIVVEEMYAPDIADLSVQVFKVQSSDAGALVIEGSTNSGAAASKAANQIGLNIPLLLSSGVTNPEFLELTGAASEGNFAVTVGYATIFERLPEGFPKGEEIGKVALDFKEKTGRSIDLFAAAGMDLVSLMAEAIRIAEEKGEVNTKSVRDAYESIADFQGMLGSYNYSPTNHIGAGNATPILIVKDGKWELHKSPDEIKANAK